MRDLRIQASDTAIGKSFRVRDKADTTGGNTMNRNAGEGDRNDLMNDGSVRRNWLRVYPTRVHARVAQRR